MRIEFLATAVTGRLAICVTVALGATLAGQAAPVPRDAVPPPTSPAPHVLYLQADATGQVTLQVYRFTKAARASPVDTVANGKPAATEHVAPLIPSYCSLADIQAKFTTADGTALSTEVILRRAKDGLVVLVSADGKQIERTWLQAVGPGVVVATADDLVGADAPRPTLPVPTKTPAPRLALLGTGADGTVRVAYNPKPGGASRAGEIRRFVTFGDDEPTFVEGYVPPPPPTLGATPVKALADVTFAAYDLDGKRVDRRAALKRLAAGGLVLIAGDDSCPDEKYRKTFKGDILILVSPELTNVPIPAGEPSSRSR